MGWLFFLVIVLYGIPNKISPRGAKVIMDLKAVGALISYS